MEEKPNYYAIIPANVRYDNELRANEKLLYGEISALANKTGICYANNEYFGNLYDVKPNAISTWIKHLKEKNYITVEYEYEENTKEIKNRYISIGGIQKDNTCYSKRYEGVIQKGEDNNTSINNIKENINNKLFIKESFKKPTLEEVREYCIERNNNINADKFYEYYEANDWKDKDNKQIKNWKQKMITWEGRSVPKKEEEKLPNWFNKDIKEQKISAEEEKELKNILESFD